MKRTNESRGFTLIELLVVITIIGLLAAILVPAITGALKGAKKARAMSQIRDLDGAIKRYFAEYGKMPVPAGYNGDGSRETAMPYVGTEQAQVIRVLINMETNLNPKQIVFLDLDPSSFGVKSVVEMKQQLAANTPYKDPWGKAYGILMDLNFDERIPAVKSFAEIRGKVGVYSVGENGNESSPPADTPYKTW